MFPLPTRYRSILRGVVFCNVHKLRTIPPDKDHVGGDDAKAIQHTLDPRLPGAWGMPLPSRPR